MSTSKLIKKIESLYNLSKNKEDKKHDKLERIIKQLEEMKSRLQQDVINESEIDETSEKYHELQKELKVISKLIKKAKKKNS